jgi:AcrR family transcriptional regulator
VLSTTRKAGANGRRPRNDAVRNRRKLLEAVGGVLATDPASVSMPLVAERAGLSTPTAYRYFSSVDELTTAYVANMLVELRDYSNDSTATGLALFEDVIGEWVRLVRVHGAATVQVRSRQGFLARLREHDDLITDVRDVWQRPIRAVLRHFGIPDEHFDHALFLYNMMFDPREILDLLTAGLTEEAVIGRLTRAYYGALHGWTGTPVSRVD